jgi:hypothetical protein
MYYYVLCIYSTIYNALYTPIIIYTVYIKLSSLTNDRADTVCSVLTGRQRFSCRPLVVEAGAQVLRRLSVLLVVVVCCHGGAHQLYVTAVMNTIQYR